MPNVFQEISKRIVETITFLTNKKLQFRDTGLYIQSSSDGVLNIVADTTVAVSGATTMDSTLAVSGATTTTGLTDSAEVNTLGLHITVEAFTATGTATANASYVNLLPATSATIEVNVRQPSAAGKILTVAMGIAGTADVIFTNATLTGGGAAGSATFNAQYETLVLQSVGTAKWIIIENLGSVAVA